MASAHAARNEHAVLGPEVDNSHGFLLCRNVGLLWLGLFACFLFGDLKVGGYLDISARRNWRLSPTGAGRCLPDSEGTDSTARREADAVISGTTVTGLDEGSIFNRTSPWQSYHPALLAVKLLLYL